MADKEALMNAVDAYKQAMLGEGRRTKRNGELFLAEPDAHLIDLLRQIIDALPD